MNLTIKKSQFLKDSNYWSRGSIKADNGVELYSDIPANKDEANRLNEVLDKIIRDWTIEV